MKSRRYPDWHTPLERTSRIPVSERGILSLFCRSETERCRQLMPLGRVVCMAAGVAATVLIGYCLFTLGRTQKKDPSDGPPYRTTWGVMGKEEVDQVIYRPVGFWVRENDIIPAVEYQWLPNCSLVFADWLNRAQSYKPQQPAPTKLPKILQNQFTSNGLINWLDDIDPTPIDKSAITWTREQIEELVLKDVVEFQEFGGQERAMYRAMQDSDVNGEKMLIFGTETKPWMEAFALKEGVLEVVRTGPINITVENYRYVRYKNPIEIARQYHSYLNKFDIAATFSIEEFGFGKFDQLNPMGDVLEIQKTYCMLKDDGMLLLGLPIGWDTVIWNKRRIYGRLRLGMLSAAFDLVGMYYYDEAIPLAVEEFEESAKTTTLKRVVLVLKKRHPTMGRF